MAVKIFIRRTVTESTAEELKPLLRKMRVVCLSQPGYISGQTLKRLDKPGERLVISNWGTVEDWEKWYTSSERQAIQLEIDTLLGEETSYAVYSSS